jgi:hypothetical protein
VSWRDEAGAQVDKRIDTPFACHPTKPAATVSVARLGRCAVHIRVLPLIDRPWSSVRGAVRPTAPENSATSSLSLSLEFCSVADKYDEHFHRSRDFIRIDTKTMSADTTAVRDPR